MRTTLTILVLGALLASSAGAGTSPPRNPYLANSSNSMGHGDPAQQDSVPQAGPENPGPKLAPGEIDYAFVGPGHFGASTSGPYPDGRRVMWSNGLDRIAKIDFDSFEVLATYDIPGATHYDEARADATIASFDASNEGFVAFLRGAREVFKFMDLSSVYTLLDADHLYYMGDKNGSITAYGDADPRDPASPIVKKRSFRLPEEATGLLIGMNITFDGWLVVVTEHGWVVAVKRDFSEHRVIRMKHSEGAANKATRRTGYGWVRNGFPIDDEGGIYIVSQEHMHKVVWTGDRLSTDEADGAWTARYLNDWSHGSGATPSLMGFGDEDRLVVITDGQPLMNVTLFWRDDIPADWKGLPGAPDRRIAGMLPADMGNDALEAIQSEQSVVVADHGALVVNNIPRNVPWYAPERLASVFIGTLGSNPNHQPFGVQKFQWNTAEQRFEEAWVNNEVSSPSCVPLVARGNDRVYLIGARDNQWTLEALDWQTGESVHHTVIGGQRYNPLFSGTLIDEASRVHYGTPWGRVRLEPNTQGSK